MSTVASQFQTATSGQRPTGHFEEHLPHERRHGEYRDVRIPLILEVGGLRDAAWAVTANEAGAVVGFHRSVADGARVIVHNVTTGRAAVARVVATQRAGEGAAASFWVALRLETYPEYFWGAAYYTASQPVH